MTKTREELVARALRELGVIGTGQEASAEDAKIVDIEIEPLMADLNVRNIYGWGDPEQIKDEGFVHIAIILANSVARQFGEQMDETKRLLAESRLRQLQTTQLSGQPQRVEYF